MDAQRQFTSANPLHNLDLVPLDSCPGLPYAWQVENPPLGWTQPEIYFSASRTIPKAVGYLVEAIKTKRDKTNQIHEEWSRYHLSIVAYSLGGESTDIQTNLVGQPERSLCDTSISEQVLREGAQNDVRQQVWQTLGDCVATAVNAKSTDQRHVAALLGIPARAARGEMSWETCALLLQQIENYPSVHVILDRVELFQELINTFIPPYSLNSKHLPEYINAAQHAWAAIADTPVSTASFGMHALARGLEQLRIHGSNLNPHYPSEFNAFRKVIATGQKIVRDIPSRHTRDVNYQLLDGRVLDVVLKVGFRKNDYRFMTDSTSALLRADVVLNNVFKLIRNGTAGDYSIPLALLKEEARAFITKNAESKSSIAKQLGVRKNDLPKTIYAMPERVMQVYSSLLSAHSQPQTAPTHLRSIAEKFAQILDRVTVELPISWQNNVQELLLSLNRPDETGTIIPWLSIAPQLLAHLKSLSTVTSTYQKKTLDRLATLLKAGYAAGGNLESFFGMAAHVAGTSLSTKHALLVMKRSITNRAVYISHSLELESSPHFKNKFNLLAETYYTLAVNKLLNKENAELFQTIVFSHSTAAKASDLVQFVVGAVIQGQRPDSGTSSVLAFIKDKLPVVNLPGLKKLTQALSCAEQCSATLLQGHPSPTDLLEELGFIKDRLSLLERAEADSAILSWLGDIETYDDLAQLAPVFSHIVCDLATKSERSSFVQRNGLHSDLKRIGSVHNINAYWPVTGVLSLTHTTPASVRYEVRETQSRYDQIKQERDLIVWENTLPLGADAHESTLQEQFGTFASMRYIPLSRNPESSHSFGATGGIFNLFEIEKVWRSWQKGKPLLEEYRTQWRPFQSSLAGFPECAIARTTDFIQIIPPDQDTAVEDQFTLFGSSYGAILFTGENNPLGVGAFLAPRERLIAMWLRNGDSVVLRPELKDVSSALKFLYQSGSPILNISSGLAINGFHLLVPTGVSEAFSWELQANRTVSRSARDSAGHFPIPTTRRSNSFASAGAPYIPTEALQRIPALHVDIFSVANDLCGFYDLFNLSRMRFVKGLLPDDQDNGYRKSLLLRYAYLFHQQHRAGLIPPSKFPIITLQQPVKNGSPHRKIVTLDTYDLQATVNGRSYQLDHDSDEPDKEALNWWAEWFINPTLSNDNLTFTLEGRDSPPREK